ncbi:AAA family ATPase [Paenibacillus sp. 23TSA30-6]|uniref:AAA family ATPase n=1 Tax=Paenibacillus sp. 23TSA30-6 TaxID=2546104 RepID=UPI0017881DB0|nr:AAA family ATPase [Paenibacillus sp. 23TSA30-6]MBE0337777.1 ATP-binding protein [Paenibacillus sp. 23TSA30-6]
MNIRVRISDLEAKNFKNIIDGKISFPSSKTQSFSNADVLGIYGQNGSGKTAIVEIFEILRALLNGDRLKKEYARLIYQDSDSASLNFTFMIKLNDKLFEVLYNLELTKFTNENFENPDLENISSEISIHVSKEEIKYKEIKKGSRPKTAIQFSRSNDEDYSVGPQTIYKKIKLNKSDSFVLYKVNSQLAFKEYTSFFFRKEGMELVKTILDQEAFELFRILKENFANNLFVLNNQQSSLTLANILIPVHYKRQDVNTGETSYSIMIFPSNEPRKMAIKLFNMMHSMFSSISKVLKEIIPGLTVELRPLGEETLKDGVRGMRAELVSVRENKVLPIACESDGIKKLISILSSLIVMYNDPNACIIIDELDAGIFEYLLGEIVKILNDSGKGQLLFTSHNLRLLEVLNKDNLVFTSTNPENRFIHLKGIKDTNNIRDVYFRAIQLGNDDESVYEVTDRYSIMDAFEEAGEWNHG